MNKYRTHHCNELRLQDEGKVVVLSGFVKNIRDLGSLAFVDLRDHYGVTQVRVEENLLEEIKNIPVESSICITGVVVKRPTVGTKELMDTKEIEVVASKIEVLNKVTNMLPFEIEKSGEVKEDLRLEYRFLDLRNDRIHKKIVLRSQVLKEIRNIMDDMGFLEVQTPIVTSSSPEGARDFLIPSRLHKGEFYALPQAPQQFKQLLMVSGFDKYYQIAPCFRDEDPRADRSPCEFYQLDFEMAFVEQQDVLDTLESIATKLFSKFTTNPITKPPFERIVYKEALDKYGSDKPDLRNPLVLTDVTDVFEGTEFKVFENKTIKAIVFDASNVTRKFFDEMVEYSKSVLELKGLAWIKIGENKTPVGSISKYVTKEMIQKIEDEISLKENDGIFFIADEYSRACKDAGNVRIELGKRLGLINENEYKFCFIVDFPFYELSDQGKIEFAHNPFSMPQGGLEALNTCDPLSLVAYQYDMVCNGYEIASGAVRNHDTEIMIKAFEIAGYSKEHVEKKFGALFHAFTFGAPPHAGAAPGIDRIIMLLAKENNIREVIAFPKNSKARDLLMQAPNFVTEEQLRDVHIAVRDEKENK